MTTTPGLVAARSHRQRRSRACAVLTALQQRSRRAGTIWTVAAGVGLLRSLADPLTVAATTIGKVSLVLSHLSFAAVLIPLMPRTASPR